MSTPPIVLRYFDARGRAQFIRFYLCVREVEHTDERVPLSPEFEAWRAIRDDRFRAGQFHKLPVLHWGDRMVAETLVIQAFLHRELGDEARLSPDENLRHAMLVSSLYHDVVMPTGTLIWADRAYPGADMSVIAKQTCARLLAHLAALERTLEEWRWSETASARPIMLADCLLWDQIDVVEHVFAEHARLDDFPTLARLYRESRWRAAFEGLLRARPASVTGRGLESEAEVLAQIRALLAG